MSLSDKLTELQDLRNNSARLAKQQSDTLSALQKAILDGETTGNPVTDFSVVAYDFDETAARCLNKFSELIDKNQGKLLLLMERYQIFPYTCSRIKDDMCCVLNGNLSFNMKNRKVIIPASKYVQQGYAHSLDPGLAHKEPPTYSAQDILPLNNFRFDTTILHGRHTKTRSILRALVDREAEEYVRRIDCMNHGEKNTLDLHIIESGKLPETNVQTQERDFTYTLMLIGLQYPLPADIQKAYDTKCQVLLQDLLEQTGKLEKQTNTDIIKKLEDSLREAIKFHMHEEPKTIDTYKGIQGCTLDVPAFIKGLTEKYQKQYA